MLDVNIDRDDPAHLHDQVAAEIRRAIADGEAAPGERLPPTRDLAKVLGVNANTVLRAMRQLRDEGLVEFRRGHGITVSGEAPARSALIERVRDLIARSTNRSGAILGAPPRVNVLVLNLAIDREPGARN